MRKTRASPGPPGNKHQACAPAADAHPVPWQGRACSGHTNFVLNKCRLVGQCTFGWLGEDIGRRPFFLCADAETSHFVQGACRGVEQMVTHRSPLQDVLQEPFAKPLESTRNVADFLEPGLGGRNFAGLSGRPLKNKRKIAAWALLSFQSEVNVPELSRYVVRSD